MELLGPICALEALKRPCQVTLISDSQYLVNAFNQNWIAGWLKRGWKNANKQPVKNVDLWKRLLAAKEPHDVQFVWVKGHAGHPEPTTNANQSARGQIRTIPHSEQAFLFLGEQISIEIHEIAIGHRGNVINDYLVRVFLYIFRLREAH